MKKILSFILIFLVTFSTFAILTPQVRADEYGNVEVTIADKYGDPVPKALVDVDAWRKYTDDSGKAHFSHIPVGEHLCYVFFGTTFNGKASGSWMGLEGFRIDVKGGITVYETLVCGTFAGGGDIEVTVLDVSGQAVSYADVSGGLTFAHGGYMVFGGKTDFEGKALIYTFAEDAYITISVSKDGNPVGSKGIGIIPRHKTTYVTVSPKPVAVLSAFPKSADVGDDITLDGSPSHDPDGFVEYYWFDYGDGSNSGWTTSCTIKHSYEEAKVYHATLKVRDNDELESDWSEKIIIVVGGAAPKTWTVDDDGPADFRTIQEAINAVNPGEIIFVGNGIYAENLIINKTVSLIGEDRQATIIDGKETGDPQSVQGGGTVVKVIEDNVTVNDFTIRNGAYGIDLVVWTKHVDICNNVVTKCWMGIVVWGDYARFVGNTFSQTHRSINLYRDSSHILIADNIFTNSDTGIFVIVSSYNNITRNEMLDCGVACQLRGTSNNLIEGNMMMRSANGVLLEWGSDNNMIRNNVLGDCHHAILLGRPWGPREGAVRNTIRNNNIENAGIAMWITAPSTENLVYNNNFVDNEKQVVTGSTLNYWNVSYPLGGNYWSDYFGVDEKSGPIQNQLGSDGIGDTPYVIDGTNQDNYPLMEPWTLMDWEGIRERAQKRGQLYELYQEAFSPSWWEDASDALISQLYGGEEDSLKSVSWDLLESLKEVLPSYIGILNSAYEATAGLITIFGSLEALKYEIVADVLFQASLRYDVQADLEGLVEKAELVAAAAEVHNLEALMDSLGQEKEVMEKLYQGTVEYEKGIWYYLATVPPPRLPPPPPEGILLTYMNEHIYLMLVEYPYYYAWDREFTLDVRHGQLTSLRSELAANYLDVTNLLGDLNLLDEVVNAPLTTRHVAPLAERGYWTVNGEEKTKAKAGDICTANVVLKPYDSMAVSGTVTVEVLEKYVWLGIPYYEPFMTHEEQIELTPGGFTTVSTPPFTADPPKNKPRFRGYHMNVKFSGEGIRNSDEEEGLVDIEVNWEEDPPDLFVPPAVVASFTLASPANLLVTAPDDLCVGYDSSTGTVVNEIEGATYSGPGTEPQVITVPYPLPGVYIVDIHGTGIGTYTLTMEFEAPDGSIITGTFTGEITQGASYVYTASLTYEEIITSPNPVAELEHLKGFIENLPDDVFVSDDPDEFAEFKKEMFDKIDETLEELYENKYTEAIEKLNDMKEEVTDEDKLQPTTESDLCVIIDHIISSIETLQQE